MDIGVTGPYNGSVGHSLHGFILLTGLQGFSGLTQVAVALGLFRLGVRHEQRVIIVDIQLFKSAGDSLHLAVVSGIEGNHGIFAQVPILGNAAARLCGEHGHALHKLTDSHGGNKAVGSLAELILGNEVRDGIHALVNVSAGIGGGAVQGVYRGRHAGDTGEHLVSIGVFLHIERGITIPEKMAVYTGADNRVVETALQEHGEQQCLVLNLSLKQGGLAGGNISPLLCFMLCNLLRIKGNAHRVAHATAGARLTLNIADRATTTALLGILVSERVGLFDEFFNIVINLLVGFITAQVSALGIQSTYHTTGQSPGLLTISGVVRDIVQCHADFD